MRMTDAAPAVLPAYCLVLVSRSGHSGPSCQCSVRYDGSRSPGTRLLTRRWEINLEVEGKCQQSSVVLTVARHEVQSSSFSAPAFGQRQKTIDLRK